MEKRKKNKHGHRVYKLIFSALAWALESAICSWESKYLITAERGYVYDQLERDSVTMLVITTLNSTFILAL